MVASHPLARSGVSDGQDEESDSRGKKNGIQHGTAPDLPV